jgi:hypothetical protein
MTKRFVERQGNFTLYNFSDVSTYRVNRLIFQGVFLMLLVLFVGAWALDGFGNLRLMNFKINCPEDRGLSCPNPFYNHYEYSNIVPVSIISAEFLPAGFVYDKNNFIADNYKLLMFIFIFLAFLINHLFYNKGFKFRKTLKDFRIDVNEEAKL